MENWKDFLKDIRGKKGEKVAEHLDSEDAAPEKPHQPSGPDAAEIGLSDKFEQTKALLLAKELDIPPLNLFKYKIPPDVVKMIPEHLARSSRIMPVAKVGSVLTIALSDPFDIVATDSVRAVSGAEIQMVISTPAQILKSVEEYYGKHALDTIFEKGVAAPQASTQEIAAALEKKEASEDELDLEAITELSQKTETIRIVNNILVDGLNSRASDIHLEPYPGVFRVRFRIDGVLQERSMGADKEKEPAIIARIKIMSNLDITQRRIPQDGRISVKIEGREIDLRVSVLPLSGGEKVVMRILEKGDDRTNLEILGFSPYALERFNTTLSKPRGMVLITGPTGSGKSTTLSAILQRLNSSETNLISIEDPVEYQMKGITQIQVKQDIGLSFAHILRAVLRQDPDIVMVGEIRDFETADIAIKAALTGHLILSTLHTNDAPSAIVRLMNMGVEPFLIAATITLLAAQRLCRKICDACKESYELSVENLIGLPADFKGKKATMYRGKGCKRCNQTGYYGRVAVVEAFVIDDQVRQLILERAPLTQIREHAHTHGMKTLREDAIDKCLKGDVSLEEALRITPEA